ncbi:hypothetical protein [Mycobacterium sp.]|uniref:hypothetical protein n=1 Tax=Mycobacterium sp. TaxID=1785 RepID=UPI003D137F6E
MAEDVDRVAAAKAQVMEFFGLTKDETWYINEDALAAAPEAPFPPESDATSDDTQDSERGVIPNRRSLMNSITNIGFNPARGGAVYQFKNNCDVAGPWYGPLFADQIQRWERSGSCAVPGGGYLARLTVWYRE